MSLLDALAKMDERFVELEALIVEPEVMGDQSRYAALLREHGGLRGKVEAYRRYRTIEKELADSRGELSIVVEDDEKAMFEEEIAKLEAELDPLLEKIRELFATEDEDANRNAIIEIRAGAGGDEAALFAGDLLRMYSNFAETMGWKIEMLEVSAGTAGGFKEVTATIMGEGVFKLLRYESGGHRVQRVPETESQGRVHTSAATVAVLPEVDAVEVDIKEADLKIDTYRSSGPGGQSVNKTSSAIRITHEPTGIVVTCQDEKSQHKNKAKAMRILASRLYEIEVTRREEERSSQRKALIGSGDRSQRIRTYNFPQNRVSDHRINLTIYSLDRILQGDMKPLLEPLIEYDKERRLEHLGE